MAESLLRHLPMIKGEVVRKEFYLGNNRRAVAEITHKGSGLFDLRLSVPSNLRFREIREQNISASRIEYVWQAFAANIDYLAYSRSV